MPATSNPAVVVPMDSSNPLFLHSSDHPGLLLVSKVFDGSAFGSWKCAMSIALSAKNKLGFVDVTVVRPTSSPNLELWKRCNDIVISCILNTQSNDISESVLYVETARQLWTELTDRYGQSNGAKYYQLQKSLSAISQENEDVATYFTKIKSIWDEVNAIEPIHPCTCGTS
ncbi:hypothetical protein L1987_20183 [Smallanthus sonchifolius]|uniref:Uncharacterized protein n=1 Tax=Smallanthus sonchifolius TaxID=185202 RepID=A0ACB9IQM6_9ASTR|nr:hypothetical protein L1987_20183 [Smallanthus sonchifolius]